MSTNELLQVPEEFTKQSLEHLQLRRAKKKGGPYSKNEKDARRDEVYRLCFEYGYSARKIADLMKVNRNTINGDIEYLYSQIFKNKDLRDPELMIVIYLERMEVQLTRLRELLDKANSNSERMSIERMIYDINSKIVNTYQKISQSAIRLNDFATEKLNAYLKKNNRDDRYLTMFDKIGVSKKAKEKINKIIKDDRGF